MNLYLIQHGEAVPKEIDPDRPLAEPGIEHISKTARFLYAEEINVDIIWHSSKLRAVESANILSKILSPKNGAEEKETLSPNDSIEVIAKIIASENQDIMIVGHLPFLQKLASFLLLGTETYDIVQFNMGGVLCLERGESGNWQMVFTIPPKLLERID